MSDIRGKKEGKTVTYDRYTIAIALDGVLTESFALEGVESTENAFERFLNWYLIYRSKYFPGLTREDIDLIKEDVEKFSLEENHPAIAKHGCLIPIKDEEGNPTKQIQLTAVFSPFRFGMLLS